MKKFLFSILCFTLIGTAHAVPITNGGFESGFSGWTHSGEAYTTDAYYATNGSAFPPLSKMLPTEGDRFAILFGGEPTSSITSDSFSVGIGDEISFDWFFSAEDYLPFNDFAGFSISLITPNEVLIADVLASVASVGNWGLTGWNTIGIPSPAAGDISLHFYVSNTSDLLLPSVFGVDNVNVTKVPTPSSLALLGIGIVILGQSRKKFLNKNLIRWEETPHTTNLEN